MLSDQVSDAGNNVKLQALPLINALVGTVGTWQVGAPPLLRACRSPVLVLLARTRGKARQGKSSRTETGRCQLHQESWPAKVLIPRKL